MKKILNKGNQIHNFISNSDSGTVINFSYGSGSGSDFLTSYGSGSTSKKVTFLRFRFHNAALQVTFLDDDILLWGLYSQLVHGWEIHIQWSSDRQPPKVRTGCNMIQWKSARSICNVFHIFIDIDHRSGDSHRIGCWMNIMWSSVSQQGVRDECHMIHAVV